MLCSRSFFFFLLSFFFQGMEGFASFFMELGLQHWRCWARGNVGNQGAHAQIDDG